MLRNLENYCFYQKLIEGIGLKKKDVTSQEIISSEDLLTDNPTSWNFAYWEDQEKKKTVVVDDSKILTKKNSSSKLIEEINNNPKTLTKTRSVTIGNRKKKKVITKNDNEKTEPTEKKNLEPVILPNEIEISSHIPEVKKNSSN